jgi:seryl-tRNA synthetase
MLDIKFIKENEDLVRQNCKNRNVKVDINRLLELYETRKSNLIKIEEMRAQRNEKSKERPSEDDIVRMRQIGDEIKKLEKEHSEAENEYIDLLYKVPNLTHKESPIGGEDSFSVLYKHGKEPKFSFDAKTHEELMLERDLIDFERGAKVAGSKFLFYKNEAVKLNQSLLNYGLDILNKHGYILVETPDLVKSEILEGSGFNPRGDESQIYEIKNYDLNLIGTSEITMLGYHMDEILDLSNGPKKYAAISHCFRTEAGAYGKESKGLYRVHQFSKLEMFIFCKPEDSEKLHQELLDIEKEICTGLELNYRVIDIPSGDLGGPAYRKYDIEAWMTMKGDKKNKGGYGEITSTSNCTDYQARRLNIRYKNEEGKTEYVHTLNGTAIVTSRFPVAIIENHQQEDKTIKIPKSLASYFGKDKI